MTTTAWTIPDLLQLSGGYWSTCALHAAVKLDLFTALADTARTAAEISHLRNINLRATGMLLDALTSLGFLEKQDAAFRNSLFATRYLSKSSPDYLGHIIMHHHHLMSGWSRLDEAVTSGSPIQKPVSQADDAIVRESFLMGMFNLASQLAPGIAAAVDLSECRTLLDLGGGPGTYAIHFCLANPELSAVVYDLPATRTFAEGTISRFELSQRIAFKPGDYTVDAVPAGFDAAWLSHILHSESPRACHALLSKAVAALNHGGTLLVQEFILNNDKSGPPFPALFSLNMLLVTETGQAYSEGELIGMMTAAGLTDVTRLTLELSNGAGVLCGHKL